MGDAIDLRIGMADRRRLEGRTGDVPLQSVDLLSAGGEVGELVEEEALAGAGEAGEEDESEAGEGFEALVEVGGSTVKEVAGWGHRRSLRPKRAGCR
jgi:hypothetical protein